ncbi:DUF2796 domain-containing protein [Parasphingorhabdus sp.]|uniref:ZrgA family zinc uptake protein n=1 Tax=Parasphingorhabdus sp. TaxID=2709688 RepID=UPI003299B030
MHLLRFASILAFSTVQAFAQEDRQLGTHEHGVGQLDIAFEGSQIAISFAAPGADIVGFEYLPKTTADTRAIEMALSTIREPRNLFIFPQGARCRATETSARLKGGSPDAHAGHNHAGRVDKKRGPQPSRSTHTEFRATYSLECADMGAIKQMEFEYFKVFPNALELDVRILSAQGASTFQVQRDNPVLDLSDQI